MIKFINAQTGTEMWVHETRVDEYLAMGHQFAPRPSAPQKAEKKTPVAKKTPKKQGD